MSRKFRNAEEAEPQHSSELPIQRDIALYYRQSSEGQIGNVSTTIQTVDMYERLLGMGWAKERVKLIDVDMAVSGKLRIDEREGMRQLFGMILDHRVGAVAAQDEDRFFRDETMIQVDTFIAACKEANVKVITPTVIYDFAHPQMGTFYARQFRFKCEMGAEYINTQILGKLNGARKYLMKTGRWAGAGPSIGYMVDARKELEPGLANPDHRRIFPLEPFAAVVREYFRVFLMFGGNIARTQQYIYEHHVSFPDPATIQPPTGFKFSFQIKSRQGGWYLSRPGLCQMLINPVYIGHWLHDGVVVRWNNHEPIVSEEVYWRAFHYLSPILLDGSPNPDYRPVRQNARPSVEVRRGTERPLCTGLLYSQIDEALLPIQAAWRPTQKHYCYYLSPYDPETSTTRTRWSRQAATIDEAVVYHVLNQLRVTFSEEGWAQMQASLQEEDHPERRLLERQLHEVEQKMQTLLNGMEFYDDPDWIQRSQTKYRDYKAERDRMLAALEPKQVRKLTLDDLTRLRAHFGEELIEHGWQGLDRNGQHLILQELVDRIILTDFDSRGSMHFEIYWRDQTVPCQPFVIVPITNRGNPFSYAEMETIRTMLSTGKTTADVYRAFPSHSKSSVYKVCRRMTALINMDSESSSRTDYKSRIYPFNPYFLLNALTA